MMCLQAALRPVVNCDSTCANIKSTAFASHASCYIQNGFCGLTCLDYWAVVWTVGGDLLTKEAVPQVIETAEGCLDHIKQVFAPGACGLTLIESALRMLLLLG